VLIRCNRPAALASRVFEQDHVVEVRLHADGGGLLVKTRDADRFYKALNHLALDGIGIESVAPADDSVNSLYEYLIGGEESTR
jgi:ABC-2 type transport system ATP-binding protein